MWPLAFQLLGKTSLAQSQWLSISTGDQDVRSTGLRFAWMLQLLGLSRWAIAWSRSFPTEFPFDLLSNIFNHLHLPSLIVNPLSIFLSEEPTVLFPFMSFPSSKFLLNFLVPHLSGEDCSILCQLLLLLLLLLLLRRNCQLPQAADDNVPHRTSTASPQWQCSPPDPNQSEFM